MALEGLRLLVPYLKTAAQMMANRRQSLECQYAVAVDEPYERHCGTFDEPSELRVAVVEEAVHDGLDAASEDTVGTLIVECKVALRKADAASSGSELELAEHAFVDDEDPSAQQRVVACSALALSAWQLDFDKGTELVELLRNPSRASSTLLVEAGEH